MMDKDKVIKIIRNEGLDSLTDIIIAAISIVFPIIAIGTSIGKGVTKLIASRTHAYKSSLSKDIVDQLELLSEDPEFIQMFYLTFQSALKAHNDIKASTFANLLNYNYLEKKGVDELFEFNEILGRLSLRDISYLEKLKNMPRGDDLSEEEFSEVLKSWKLDLENEFGEKLEYIDSIYLKLQGYGFCKKWSHRIFLGQRFNEFWELTPYYLNFSEFHKYNENI